MNPVVQINVLAIKPGKIDEFIETDRRYAAANPVPKGVTGSRTYRSLDGASVVRVTQYESLQAHDEVQQDVGLRQRISMLRPLVESASRALYEEAPAPGSDPK